MAKTLFQVNFKIFAEIADSIIKSKDFPLTYKLCPHNFPNKTLSQKYSVFKEARKGFLTARRISRATACLCEKENAENRIARIAMKVNIFHKQTKCGEDFISS